MFGCCCETQPQDRIDRNSTLLHVSTLLIEINKLLENVKMISISILSILKGNAMDCRLAINPLGLMLKYRNESISTFSNYYNQSL